MNLSNLDRYELNSKINSLIAFDIDRMEQLGIYEVAPEDFAACEFVDTSKLPLQDIIRKGLDALRKEMN